MTMESKVVTKNLVTHVAKSLLLEQFAVSGTLYISVDKKLFYAQKFRHHIKVQIAFDNNVDEVRSNQQHSVYSPGHEEDRSLNNNPVNSQDNGDFLIDDVPISNMNSGGASKVNVDSHNDMAILAEECKNVLSKHRGLKKTSTSKSKLSAQEKIISPGRSLSVKSERTLGKSSADKINESKETEIVKIEIDEDGFDSDEKEKDFTDQETKVKRENGNSDTSETVSCSYCSMSFKSHKEFSHHRKVETKNRYPCPKCPRLFRYKAYLMIHVKSRHQEERVEKTSDHGDLVESDGKSEKCEICGAVYAHVNNLKRHLLSHTSEYSYQCCVCPHQMCSVSAYYLHMRRHSKSGPIQCKICNIRVSSRGELAKHRLTHPLHCGLCGQVFSSRTGRYVHYKTVHKNDNNLLKCSQCDRLYSSKETLELHLKYHKNRKTTQCPVCGLFFSRIKKHMSLAHASTETNVETIDKTFVCDKCPKHFSNKTALDRHLYIHSGEKRYACPECSKQFSLSGGLRRHMAVHLQEKPHVCKVCGKACSQKGNLKIHMRVHKTDKPSKFLHCSQCGTSFSHKNALQKHIDEEHSFEESSSILQFPQEYFQMSTPSLGEFS